MKEPYSFKDTYQEISFKTKGVRIKLKKLAKEVWSKPKTHKINKRRKSTKQKVKSVTDNKANIVFWERLVR